MEKLICITPVLSWYLMTSNTALLLQTNMILPDLSNISIDIEQHDIRKTEYYKVKSNALASQS